MATSWTLVARPAEFSGIVQVFSLADGTLLLLGGSSTSLARSGDGGRTWETLALPPEVEPVERMRVTQGSVEGAPAQSPGDLAPLFGVRLRDGGWLLSRDRATLRGSAPSSRERVSRERIAGVIPARIRPLTPS